MKIIHTVNQTTILTGHGNIKAYLHRFHISEEQMCPCGEGDQSTNHIFYDSAELKEEREKLKAALNKTEDWPISKRDLLRDTIKNF